MFKEILLSCAILLLSVSVVADELKDDCEPAVDAADRLSTNPDRCDYSKTGLNGVLHKAFANKSNVSSVDVKNTIKSHAVAVEVGSANQLATVRYELLLQAAQECRKGFIVDNEQYLPTSSQHLQLELNYHCLQ